MEDAQWQQLKDLFFQFIDLSEEDRAVFLEQITDKEIRDALMRLIAEDAEAASLLDASPHDLALLVDEEEEMAEPIQQIGPYRISKTLGRGGMGTVYLAERDDGAFRQQVALKVIRRGLDTDDILRRFRMERQILAALTHPHIAHILDGGTTKDGLPYFVMEYIDGVPITTYCDRHRLSVDARLALFRDVCQAVQYAHANLIVHRDLKPSNMLVTDEGQVKLLDFGIAKLLDPNLPGYSSPLTRTAWRVMTPEYASPEQVRGEAITTASDVYALGVLLYELLTGRRPYRLPSRLEQEIFRVICEVEPERPSTAVSQIEEVQHSDGQTDAITPEQVSEARSTQVERLRRRLRGDLDNIVLKALQKEPTRRYASVEQFAEDVRRYKAGLPVVARRETVTYRISKFVRRHRVGVLASALIVLAVLGGLGASLWQARAKTLEAARAEAVKAFVLDLFDQANPEVAQGEMLTALDLAEQGAARVRETLNDQPEVQTEMLIVLANVYRKLGAYDEALELLEDALHVRKSLYGNEHIRTAEALDRLGAIQMDRANYDKADSLLTDALRIRRAKLGETHPDVAETLYNLGALHGAARQGQPEEAVAFYRQSLAIRQRVLGDNDPALLKSQHGLAIALWDQGDYAAAETMLYDVLERQRQAQGGRHPETLRTMKALATSLAGQMKHDEAIPLYRDLIASQKEVLGEAHPEVAASLFELAVTLNNRERKENQTEVEALHREALAIRRAALGEEHPAVATSLASLSLALITLERYAEAIAPAEQALALHRRTLGEEHRRIAVDHLFLAKALYQSQELRAADHHFSAAYDLALRTWPDDHFILTDILIHHGQMLQEQARIAEAEAMLEEGLRVLAAQPQQPPSLLAIGKLRLGLCRAARQEYKTAEPMMLEALQYYTQLEDDEGIELTHAGLADLYAAWGKPDLASQYR
ncbi:MAG TPA: tetratricopeptide repeat protein [Rhodothermales bacterium]|nr:tetratricopeptide repeat protein [Rhodothermales bacterium]